MEIKKFKFLLCIPIACSFIGVLHGQPWNPCANLGAQLEQCVINYDECQTNCSYCANGWLTGVTDCASICNNPSCSINACDQLREQYHNCNAGNNTGSTNTGSTNTGSTNTGSTNTGSTNTGSTNTGSTNTGSTNTGSTNTGSTNTGGNNTGSNNTGSEEGYANPSCDANLPQSSTNGCSNYSSAGSWYCNNGNGISLYISNNSGNTFNQQTQTTALAQYRNFYNSGKSESEKIGNPSFNSQGGVWNLQKLIGVTTDCKLGNNTINKFLTTDFCTKINSEWTTSSGGSCPELQELEGVCCKPSSCEKLLSGGSCEVYGSGYIPDGNCCVFDCGEGKNCPEGEIRSTGTCECVCNPAAGCCGVQLNVPIPFIGDCIELTTSNNVGGGSREGTLTINQLNAFPYLIQGLSKILVTLIMIFSIIIVIVAGLMMTTSVASEQNYKKGVDMLKKVLIALILLGTSGLILKLINPNFFGG